jgi:hypothetical protein
MIFSIGKALEFNDIRTNNSKFKVNAITTYCSKNIHTYINFRLSVKISKNKIFFQLECNVICKGKSPIMRRFPNMGRCIISYQEVLRSEVKNVNHQADEAILSIHSINGQFLRTSVLIGCICFGAL